MQEKTQNYQQGSVNQTKRMDLVEHEKKEENHFCNYCCISTVYVCCCLAVVFTFLFLIGGIIFLFFTPQVEIQTVQSPFFSYFIEMINIYEIYPLIVPAVICFVLASIITCCIGFGYCFFYCIIWRTMCLGKLGIKFEQNESEQTTNAYMEKLTKKEANGMGLNVRCSHRERRSRYVYRGTGDRRRRVRETYYVTVTSFNQDFPLTFQTCKDTSIIPNLSTSSSELIDFSTELTIHYEKPTYDYMKRYQSHLYEKYKHMDTTCKVTFLKPYVQGIKKDFRFSKTGRVPQSVEAIIHPFKSLYGCFLMSTCLICFTRIKAVSAFQKVNYEVQKVLGISTENLQYFPDQKQEHMLHKKVQENQQIIAQQQILINQQQQVFTPPQPQVPLPLNPMLMGIQTQNNGVQGIVNYQQTQIQGQKLEPQVSAPIY